VGVLEFPQLPSLNRFFGVGVVVLVWFRGNNQGARPRSSTFSLQQHQKQNNDVFFLSATPQHPLSLSHKRALHKNSLVRPVRPPLRSRAERQNTCPERLATAGQGCPLPPLIPATPQPTGPEGKVPKSPPPPSGALYTAPDPLQPASGDLPLSRHDSSPTTARYLRQRGDIKIYLRVVHQGTLSLFVLSFSRLRSTVPFFTYIYIYINDRLRTSPPDHTTVIGFSFPSSHFPPSRFAPRPPLSLSRRPLFPGLGQIFHHQ